MEVKIRSQTSVQTDTSVVTLLRSLIAPPCSQEARQLPDLKDISLPVLERYFNRLFALADTDGNGVLDPREFHNVRSRSGRLGCVGD